MFGKLFGRGKAKRDQLGFEVSALGIPGTETTTVTTTTTDVPATADFDLGALLATVKAAQDQTGGDRGALADMLRKQFGDGVVVSQESVSSGWSAMPDQDPIALLATLTELHEKGVVSDEQFEEHKRRLLG